MVKQGLHMSGKQWILKKAGHLRQPKKKAVDPRIYFEKKVVDPRVYFCSILLVLIHANFFKTCQPKVEMHMAESSLFFLLSTSQIIRGLPNHYDSH